MPRILIFGNSGSGKSTLSKSLATELGLPYLDLDTIAWGEVAERRPLDESLKVLDQFIHEFQSWVIEGCYASLIEHVAGSCSEMRFFNPGIDVCLANNMARPWEPQKYESLEAQNEHFEFLQNWVREYETRDDEFSLVEHRRIFDAFEGTKKELI